MEKELAKRGSLIQIESGEYSDYQVDGFFVALDDFYPMQELQKYLEKKPKEKEPYSFDKYGFIAYLCKRGLLLEINRSVFYVGAYGSLEEITFRTP